MKPKQEDSTLIVLHDSVWQSLQRDIITFIMIVGVIGTGRWLNSDAMQWIGFMMLCLGAVSVAKSGQRRMPPQQAANMIAEKFGVFAHTGRP